MTATFQGVDFYDVESLLSEEEVMIRDTVREWVDDRLMPIIGEAYIGRRFPQEIIPAIGELGGGEVGSDAAGIRSRMEPGQRDSSALGARS